jgi:hypothetical protein
MAVRARKDGVSNMMISNKGGKHLTPTWITFMGIALIMLALALPAMAVLGGDETSVQADNAYMKGSLETTQSQAFTVHEIKSSIGTVVREYVSPQGTVFGVAWQGPFMPDMQQLLGTYFQQYIAAVKAAKAGRPGRRPLNIQDPGLVVQSGGHMRAYVGKIYVPEMVPQGITADAIR